MIKKIGLFVLATSVFFAGCVNNKQEESTDTQKKETRKKPEIEKRVEVSYSMLISKDSIKAFLKLQNDSIKELIADINRVDRNILTNFDTLVIPSNFQQKKEQYFPFPFYVSAFENVNKIILFSYPAQSFAAYANGVLVRTGPTSMGRKADKTPTGLFYCNWKAEETTSTFNDEWNLKWNFNIENKLGVGFHQYDMPGYPASHSCLRLKEKDAVYLYNWAEQWKIKGTDDILANGTPVIVFGEYPFGSSRPWYGLKQNAQALNINEADIDNISKSFVNEIMQKQAVRDSIKS